MAKFIKSLNLRWSDLFLAIGFVCFALFTIFGQIFIQFQNPADVFFPLPAIIVTSLIGLGSWAIYLALEYKEGTFKLNFIFIILVFLALLNTIVIVCQPSEIYYDVLVRAKNLPNPTGALIPVHITISSIHKVVFSMEIIFTCLLIYIGLFLFPKRIKSLTFLQVLTRLMILVIFITIVVSFCIEGKQYVEFIKHLANGTKLNDMEPYTVKSYTPHRNGFGMVLLLGIIVAMIDYNLTESNFNIVRMIFYTIIMVFTLCKASLFIAAILLVTYIFYRLICGLKNHKSRNIALLTIFSLIVITGISLILLSFISQGKYLGFLYVYDNITRTLETRLWIWQNTIQTLENGNWAIGRGFGIINLIIYPMNLVNNDPVYPTHNSFIGLLGEGGIFFLLAYLALIAYAILIIRRSWKKNPGLIFTIALCLFVFFLYGLIETNQFILYILLLPLFLFYETEVKNAEK